MDGHKKIDMVLAYGTGFVSAIAVCRMLDAAGKMIEMGIIPRELLHVLFGV